MTAELDKLLAGDSLESVTFTRQQLIALKERLQGKPAAEKAAVLSDEPPFRFAHWFRKNYPSGISIHDPDWHAPKIYRAAIAAHEAAKPAVAAWEWAPGLKLADDEVIHYSQIYQTAEGLPVMTDSSQHSTWNVASVFKRSADGVDSRNPVRILTVEPSSTVRRTAADAAALCADGTRDIEQLCECMNQYKKGYQHGLADGREEIPAADADDLPAAWISTNRVSGKATLAYAKVSSEHDATLYSHEPLFRRAGVMAADPWAAGVITNLDNPEQPLRIVPMAEYLKDVQRPTDAMAAFQVGGLSDGRTVYQEFCASQPDIKIPAWLDLTDIGRAYWNARAEVARPANVETRTYTREEVQQWRDDIAHAAADLVERAAPGFGDGDWSWLVDGIRSFAKNSNTRADADRTAATMAVKDGSQ